MQLEKRIIRLTSCLIKAYVKKHIFSKMSLERLKNEKYFPSPSASASVIEKISNSCGQRNFTSPDVGLIYLNKRRWKALPITLLRTMTSQR